VFNEQVSLRELSECVSGLGDLLECPVCLLIPRLPVHVLQCPEGHVVCSTCRAKLAVCAQCKTFLGANNVVRNRRMEDVIERIKSMAL
jgi:E3 ubiquitin-protein ligase SIAH1